MRPLSGASDSTPQGDMTNSGDWPGRWVRTRLEYEPRDLTLFVAALTHRSAPGRNNERLEFLGDAVLNLAIARHLYLAFPQASEGDLSRLRARLVSADPLAEVAAGIGLGDELQLGSGEPQDRRLPAPVDPRGRPGGRLWGDIPRWGPGRRRNRHSPAL